MKLKLWMVTHKVKQGAMAKRLGISRVHLNGIINERSRPSPGLAKRIETETRGRVKAIELLYPTEA